ncbi:MAG: hypothetical protein U0638_03465 [Phycisphaerales bacterium]
MSTIRASNCIESSRCESSSSATSRIPEVSMSRRWTTIGPVASGNIRRPISTQFGTFGFLPGTDSTPLGLLIAT